MNPSKTLGKIGLGKKDGFCDIGSIFQCHNCAYLSSGSTARFILERDFEHFAGIKRAVFS